MTERLPWAPAIRASAISFTSSDSAMARRTRTSARMGSSVRSSSEYSSMVGSDVTVRSGRDLNSATSEDATAYRMSTRPDTSAALAAAVSGTTRKRTLATSGVLLPVWPSRVPGSAV